MINIITSDLFRVRKGAAFYGVMIGILVLILSTGGILTVIRSSSFQKMVGDENSLFSVEIMSEDDRADIEKLKAAEDELPQNGGEFIKFMMAEAGEGMALLLLPFIIAIFGADFSTGTFRNLISHGTNRNKIYLAKMCGSLILTVLMLLSFIILSGVVGAAMFGFAGFSGALLVEIIGAIVRMLPILMAFICIGHCIIAFTKRSSYTIAIYLVGTMVWALILQVLAMLRPGMQWLMQLELMSAVGAVTGFSSLNGQIALSGGQLIVPMVFSLILIVGSLAVGMNRYKRLDFDF